MVPFCTFSAESPAGQRDAIGLAILVQRDGDQHLYRSCALRERLAGRLGCAAVRVPANDAIGRGRGDVVFLRPTSVRRHYLGSHRLLSFSDARALAS